MTIHTAQVGVLGTNCYIVETEKKNAIIIDPGSQGKELANWMDNKGLTPKKIILTHAHHDHIGGISELLESYPELPIYMGPEQESTIKLAVDRMGDKKSADIVISDAKPIKDGDEISQDEITFKVKQTPGHTSGGVIFISGEHLFSGDTVFREEIGRCDLPTGNYQTMLNSLKEIAQLPGDYKIYPGHGPASTLEHERKYNPYMRNLV